MIFNYFSKGCKASRYFERKISLSELVAIDCDNLVDEYRKTKVRDIKDKIPAFCPMGINKEGSKTRSIKDMQANGLAMIDLDHIGLTYEQLRQLVLKIDKQSLVDNQTVLVYITCSGEGLRFVYNQFAGCNVMQSAIIYLERLKFTEDVGNFDPLMYLDSCTTDISRLSILTKREDYFYACDEDFSTKANVLTKEERKHLDIIQSACSDIKEWIKNYNKKEEEKPEVKEETPKTTESVVEEDEAKPIPSDRDNQNVHYRDYTEKQVEENDKLYCDVRYKGRLVRNIVESYVSYKTRGMGPGSGEKHTLYSLLCRNFRNVVDNDPRVLHAVLPSFNHNWQESWRQCYYYTSVSKSPMLPKDFYFWMKQHGFDVEKSEEEDDEESAEDKFYNDMIANMPPLPPIIREFVKIAPKWFKIPVIASLQCYCALLATNFRAYYFDGTPLSTTLYSLVYAPAASGKGYVRRLKSILESTDNRDKLAMQKAKWYDRQQRQNNGSGKLPEEVVWKQRLFASKTSLGEILKRQEAIGEHHWLQDVGEFSIWAATIKKNKEEWSAFFRTSYDNEEFSQSYQSANSYRGKVPIFPIVHGTCTLGQIKSFFTNVEDGLLTRFSFVPLLHQRYASYQPWKVLSDKDQSLIDKTVERLDDETYKVSIEEEGEDKSWDYEFKDPTYHDLQFLHKPILDWLEKNRKSAEKDDNEALDTFRRRCARNAFIYGIICYALWGKKDKKTQENIIKNMLWDADLKLFYMRYLWEDTLNDELNKGNESVKGFRNKSVYETLPQTFTRQRLEEAILASGAKSKPKHLICNWKTGGWIKETSKFTYKKLK